MDQPQYDFQKKARSSSSQQAYILDVQASWCATVTLKFLPKPGTRDRARYLQYD